MRNPSLPSTQPVVSELIKVLSEQTRLVSSSGQVDPARLYDRKADAYRLFRRQLHVYLTARPPFSTVAALELAERYKVAIMVDLIATLGRKQPWRLAVNDASLVPTAAAFDYLVGLSRLAPH